MDWSLSEVELLVADYFAMLEAELRGQLINKAERNRALQVLLPGRSKGSIEFKHQNVSAVLINFDLPYIAGYKPRQNYQALLERIVLERFEADAAFPEWIARTQTFAPSHPPQTDFADLMSLEELPPDPPTESASASRTPVQTAAGSPR